MLPLNLYGFYQINQSGNRFLASEPSAMVYLTAYSIFALLAYGFDDLLAHFMI